MFWRGKGLEGEDYGEGIVGVKHRFKIFNPLNSNLVGGERNLIRFLTIPSVSLLLDDGSKAEI